jgi:hypothetical protein
VLHALATLLEIDGSDHGVLESEQLSLGSPPLPARDWLAQLEAVLALQRRAGRKRFLLSATVESAEDLAALRAAVACEAVLVVCLCVSPDAAAARIDAREPERWPGKASLVRRARELARSTPGLEGVDLPIDTESREPRDVAAEIMGAMRARGLLDDPERR